MKRGSYSREDSFFFFYIVEGFTVKLEAVVTIFIVQDSLFIAGDDYFYRYC